MPNKKNKNNKRTKAESSPGYSSEQPDKCLIMSSDQTPPGRNMQELNSSANSASLQTPPSQPQPSFIGPYFPPHLQYSFQYPPQHMSTPQQLPMAPATPQQVRQETSVSPSGLEQGMFNSIMDKLKSIENVQAQMQSKLSKLDDVENSVRSVMNKLTMIENRVSSLEISLKSTDSKINDLEASRNFDSQVCEELKSENQSLMKRVIDHEEKAASISSEVRNLEKANVELSETVVDLQSRSMRENLLFYNFEECKSPDERRSENCEEKVIRFCEEILEIDGAKARFKIDRAHRVGKFERTKSRPIVVKFNFFGDKVEVKNAARSKLSRSQYGVGDQFPDVIRERRRQLIPYFVEAKSMNKSAVLSYDKLYMDNTTYTVNNLPPWPAPPLPRRNSAGRQFNTE